MSNYGWMNDALAWIAPVAAQAGNFTRLCAPMPAGLAGAHGFSTIHIVPSWRSPSREYNSAVRSGVIPLLIPKVHSTTRGTVQAHSIPARSI